MAYDSIADGEIDGESPITTTLCTKFRDNPIAIANGDTGAPKIQTAALETTGGSEAVTQDTIRADAVGTAELKIGTDTSSSATGGIQWTPACGGYGFLVRTRVTNTSSQGGWGGIANGSYYPVGFGNNTSFAPKVSITENGSYLAYGQVLYVQASPPYDLGDGEIPLFIWAMIENSSGKILATSTAPEATWHLNGPTDIVPDIRHNGIGYKKQKDLSGVSLTLAEAKIAGVTAIRDYYNQLKEAPTKLVEIDQEMKNRDINIFPHPFQGNDLTGKTIVMLDPVSDLVLELSEMREFGEDVNDMIHENYFKISNTALDRVTPDGVIVVAGAWKNTVE